jgi:anti-sigma regulatory factor (Ser/Thr protein kinase)
VTIWSRNFEGRAEHLSDVREFAHFVTGDRNGAELVKMVASELAGNAIVHSASGRPGGHFTLQVAHFCDRWQVRCIDEGGSTVPHLCEPPPIESDEDLDKLGDEVEYGRGLAIVAAVSSSWGVSGDEISRAVWAEILIPKAATV